MVASESLLYIDLEGRIDGIITKVMTADIGPQVDSGDIFAIRITRAKGRRVVWRRAA